MKALSVTDIKTRDDSGIEKIIDMKMLQPMIDSNTAFQKDIYNDDTLLKMVAIRDLNLEKKTVHGARIAKNAQDIIDVINNKMNGNYEELGDLKMLLSIPVTEDDMKYPARPDLYVKEAKKRLTKSKTFNFHDVSVLMEIVDDVLKGKEFHAHFRMHVAKALKHIDLASTGLRLSIVLNNTISMYASVTKRDRVIAAIGREYEALRLLLEKPTNEQRDNQIEPSFIEC